MRYLIACLVTAAGLGTIVDAEAAERSVTLEVEGMTCASCPYMVRQALLDVDGVMTVEVSYERERARVAYDDKVADLDDLTRATGGIGFPSQPVEERTDG
jgi:mercuric ion binding protein